MALTAARQPGTAAPPAGAARRPGDARPGRAEGLEQWNRCLRFFPYATAAALVAVAVTAYARSLTHGFIYDDESQILLNPFVVNPHLWPRIFSGSAWSFEGQGLGMNFYRPLRFVCYWILYRGAGPAPAAFHALNVLIYALTVLLVYRLGVRLLGGEVPALAGALLWALHPSHVEATAWISALPDLGCGFFFLLAFLLFLRAETLPQPGRRGHVLAALAYLPALFFKEAALTLPLVLLAYRFFLEPREAREAADAKGRWWLNWSLYLAPVAFYLAARRYALGRFAETAHLWRVKPQDVEAALGLMGQHFRIFFWPAGLSVFRTFELGASLRSPWPWLALAVLVFALAGRRRQPLVGFLVWWWFLTLLPCLDVRQLSSPLVADRFSYLPSVGLCLAISQLALEQFPARLPRLPSLGFAAVSLLVLLLLESSRTAQAVAHWRDEESLLGYSLKQSPDSPSLHWSRGIVFEYRNGDYQQAENEYRLALQLNHSSFRPIAQLDYESTLGLGRVAQHGGDLKTAMTDYESAVRLFPHLSPAYDALGAMFFPRQDYARAATWFERAVQVNSQDLGARFYLGNCYLNLGRGREAAQQFHATTVIDPTFQAGYDAETRALRAASESRGAAGEQLGSPK